MVFATIVRSLPIGPNMQVFVGVGIVLGGAALPIVLKKEKSACARMKSTTERTLTARARATQRNRVTT